MLGPAWHVRRSDTCAPSGRRVLNVPAYLKRIDYHGPLDATAETLRALHRAHLQAVPFENLDIHLGRQIVLDETALFDKIVERRRGEFCYELNGLFAWLLRQLGFDVTLLSARVASGEGAFGPEFDHLTLLLNLEERRPAGAASSRAKPSPRDGARWLADVGFGECFDEPLTFDDPLDQVRGGRAYRLAHGDTACKLLVLEEDGGWDDQYLFGYQPRQLNDFAEMCVWQQTSPESFFTRKRVCTRITPEGRITLSDMRLIVTANGERVERELRSEEEVAAVLREHFGIDLSLV
ncbi:MAG: arylamine N-acetyltransferase [Chloroflexi bacterium]|nr:arylamine N-acetyltransferase [Chloroflexota bacterium]